MSVLKKITALIIVIGAAGAMWWYAQGGSFLRPDIEQLRQIAQNAADTVTDAAKNISTPPPLRATKESPTANLTRDGVLTWTNSARTENGGLHALTLNARLSAAAEAKIDDMFAKQYFEHDSPSGVGPGDLADAAGYLYISVGENLALGNFENDQVLVQAWMDSPGHRANIVGNYDEIGIAVRRGTFEGRTTWLAVQEFGRPLSACPAPDPTLKAKLDAGELRLNALVAQADALHVELEASKKPRTREQADAYNEKVGRYNALAEEINALNQSLQQTAATYNSQAQAFNACAQQ